MTAPTLVACPPAGRSVPRVQPGVSRPGAAVLVGVRWVGRRAAPGCGVAARSPARHRRRSRACRRWSRAMPARWAERRSGSFRPPGGVDRRASAARCRANRLDLPAELRPLAKAVHPTGNRSPLHLRVVPPPYPGRRWSGETAPACPARGDPAVRCHSPAVRIPALSARGVVPVGSAAHRSASIGCPGSAGASPRTGPGTVSRCPRRGRRRWPLGRDRWWGPVDDRASVEVPGRRRRRHGLGW